ncbi:MAG: aminotransferase class V-fold PLP-dependent enzyme [Caldilineaceae bacterium]|nr:aminotransferase class V-fold PLP-dependent enzyme [Caldilineaceae bacterium]
MMSTQPATPPDFAAVRADFPRAQERLWLAAAETHPYGLHTLRALERYTQFRTWGPGAERHSFTAEMQAETKALFAALIGATPAEIAFVQSTTDGENLVLAGLGLSQPGAKPGGNIVIDDLHFEASKYIYTHLAKAGNIELRVVPHRDWQINFADIEAAIDEQTKLVSLALVSQVNGYLADVQAITRLAHAHGAYVYADLIQAAGNTPLDMTAMGIDFAACATYKWLMGDFGIGFLYIRAGLHETVEPTRFSLRQVQAQRDYAFTLHRDATRYEGSQIAFLAGVCAHAGLNYITALGVEQIRTHAQQLTARLQQELPALGYQPITPLDAPTPIVSFLPTNMAETQAKLDRAFGHQVVSFREWYRTNEQGEREMVRGMRLGISVYNNDEDIDKFLEALA